VGRGDEKLANFYVVCGSYGTSIRIANGEFMNIRI
jgi:hypothetical protein